MSKWLQGLQQSVAPARRSEDFRRSFRNASWNCADYMALPLLLLLATPFLVSHLGTQHFGIWMLVTALTGMMGVLNFGLGDATVKYVSAYRARNDLQGVARVVRSTLTMYSLLGATTSVGIIAIAPLLVRHFFK